MRSLIALWLDGAFTAAVYSSYKQLRLHSSYAFSSYSSCAFTAAVYSSYKAVLLSTAAVQCLQQLYVTHVHIHMETC